MCSSPWFVLGCVGVVGWWWVGWGWGGFGLAVRIHEDSNKGASPVWRLSWNRGHCCQEEHGSYLRPVPVEHSRVSVLLAAVFSPLPPFEKQYSAVFVVVSSAKRLGFSLCPKRTAPLWNTPTHGWS